MVWENQKKKLCSLHFDAAINLMKLETGNNEVVQFGTDYNCNEGCKKVKDSELKKYYMKKLEINLRSRE